jgi:hypothetical protein
LTAVGAADATTVLVADGAGMVDVAGMAVWVGGMAVGKVAVGVTGFTPGLHAETRMALKNARPMDTWYDLNANPAPGLSQVAKARIERWLRCIVILSECQDYCTIRLYASKRSGTHQIELG